jgi:hypothetical protein
MKSKNGSTVNAPIMINYFSMSNEEWEHSKETRHSPAQGSIGHNQGRGSLFNI